MTHNSELSARVRYEQTARLDRQLRLDRQPVENSRKSKSAENSRKSKFLIYFFAAFFYFLFNAIVFGIAFSDVILKSNTIKSAFKMIDSMPEMFASCIAIVILVIVFFKIKSIKRKLN